MSTTAAHQQAPTLFVSLKATIQRIAQGDVGEDDLVTGLFFFSGTRDFALDPWGHVSGIVRGYLEDNERIRAAHSRLVSALLASEERRRVSWERPLTCHEVSTFLRKHGFGEIPPEHDDPIEALEKTGHQLGLRRIIHSRI